MKCKLREKKRSSSALKQNYLEELKKRRKSVSSTSDPRWKTRHSEFEEKCLSLDRDVQ